MSIQIINEKNLLAGTVVLPAVEDAAWALLAEGVSNRHAPAHKPVVATVDREGLPRARVVVLRRVDRPARLMAFNTDIRSDKVSDLRHCPRINLVFYDPAAKTQVRVFGQATVHHRDSAADTAWETATVLARRCYNCAPGPGALADKAASGLPPPLIGRAFDGDDVAAGRDNFCTVHIIVHRIDWLYLTVDGNRAARFEWDDGGAVTASWRIP